MDARARLTWAVRNNASWCDLVCRSHQIQTRFQPGLWSTTERPPQFYPDAVTLEANITEEDVLTAIEPGPGASVKDSYATLDLGRHGFEQLFEARWITYDRRPPQPGTTLGWTVVETEEAFAEWTEAAGLTNILGDDLLHRPDVRFLAADSRQGIGATAVANLTGPVVGVSNVFATTIGDDEAWAGIPTAVEAVFPDAVLVGYEHGVSLRAAAAAGFCDVGPLRVWLAPPAD
jgi:hypothetical protein